MYRLDENMRIVSTDETLNVENLKNQNFVLFFYSKNNTSACNFEALSFADLYDEFRALGFNVYGVSKDTVGSHSRFRDKMCLPYHLISDEDRVLIELFKVLVDKKMYGKPVKGTERSTFVFKEGLKLVKEFRKVDAKVHAKEVLDFIQDL